METLINILLYNFKIFIQIYRLLPSTKILALHGKMKKKRHKIFEEFQTLESGLLICTDVLARGIDIPEVDWVIQYDPPSSASCFVHRSVTKF